MGYYVNPPDMSKDKWLHQNGKLINEAMIPSFWTTQEAQDHLPVCLVDNGDFKAAGIAYSPGEAQAFLRPDGRPKTWYIVPFRLLLPFMKAHND